MHNFANFQDVDELCLDAGDRALYAAFLGKLDEARLISLLPLVFLLLQKRLRHHFQLTHLELESLSLLLLSLTASAESASKGLRTRRSLSHLSLLCGRFEGVGKLILIESKVTKVVILVLFCHVAFQQRFLLLHFLRRRLRASAKRVLGVEFNESAIFLHYMKIAHPADAAVVGQMVHQVRRSALRSRRILYN